MAIDWKTVRDAIYDWAHNSTGLDIEWSNQRRAQSARPYGVLNMIGPPKMLGGDDALVISTDLSAGAGREIQQTYFGNREITVSLQIFSSTTAGMGQAMEYMSLAQSALNRESFFLPLLAAGVSVVNFGPPTDMSGVESATYVSRAALPVKFAVVDKTVDQTGYIETVEITPTYDGVAFPVDDVVLP